MVPASGARKRPVTESPLEDSLPPPAKEAVNSKVSKKNSGGRGTIFCRGMSPSQLKRLLAVAAPLISVMAGFFSLIMALSILTLNCNGIRDQSKRVGLVQWLRSLSVGADVVCLQETNCLSSSECSLWFRSSDFSAVVSPGSSHLCGCIVLFRPLLSLVNSWCDVSGR